MVKERKSEEELRQMMLAAARQHEDCGELEDLFIFGPTPRLDANWGFGIAGKENKVSVACYMRLDQIASHLQENMSCIRSKGTGAISKPGSGPWSMTNLHSRRGSRAPAAPTKSPSSKNSKVGRIGQWNGVLTINWPKLPLNGSFGLFKRKLSWTKSALSKSGLDLRAVRQSLARLFAPIDSALTVVIRLYVAFQPPKERVNVIELFRSG